MDEKTKKESEAPEEQSFAELFEQSFVKPARLEPGQKVEATIVKVSNEWIFIDLGGKSEGYLEKKELLDENGNLTVREGDRICSYFLSSANNERLFTTRLASGPAAHQHLEEAFQNAIPVEGLIEKEIKGGFSVKIAGSLRGFCPYSQTGMKRTENQADYTGKTKPFIITEYRDNGRSIILSHKKILDEENRQRKEALQASLKTGMTIKGVVSSIQKFGAFVDIGGVEGLIPISEISWARVENVADTLAVGQEVEVIIKELDWGKNRLSFSLKEALPDPWEQVAERFPEESCHSGKVARLMPFGAFVTIGSGIDGLIHISGLGQGKRINNPREVLSEGQTVSVKVTKVDREKRRLSLAIVSESAEEEHDESYKQYMKKASTKPSGSLGTLADAFKAKYPKKEKR